MTRRKQNEKNDARSRFLARSPGGFTLFEVLIAIALMLALVGSMFGFLFDMLHSRGRAQEYGGQQRAASTLIDRLDSDLVACIVGDSSSGAGVKGDEHHLRILTRAVFANAAESDVDDAEVFGDLQLAEYRFVPEQQRLEARRSPAGAVSQASAFLPFHDPKVAIPHVRFRYFDGQQWQASFDSLESNHLPVAVEVAIWFNPWPGDSLHDSASSGWAEADEVPDSARSATTRSAAFDDEAYARRGDRGLADEPPPDRVRVILIPDAAGDDETGGST